MVRSLLRRVQQIWRVRRSLASLPTVGATRMLKAPTGGCATMRSRMTAKFPAIPVEQGAFFNCSLKCRLGTENGASDQWLARFL
jgi:hypothetical protein